MQQSAPPASAGYRYWRMVIVDSYGSPTGLQEIQFRTTPGGPSITTATTPVLVSNTNDALLRHGSRTVDRGASGYAWITQFTGGVWCAWDLLSPVQPVQFEFQPVSDVVQRAPKIWELQANNVSMDNSAPWVTRYSRSDSPMTFAWQVIVLS